METLAVLALLGGVAFGMYCAHLYDKQKKGGK